MLYSTIKHKVFVFAKDLVLMLSQYNKGTLGTWICNSSNNFWLYVTSNIIIAKDQNYASMEDLDTTLCLLEFHDKKEFSKNIYQSLILLRSFKLAT